MEGLPSVRGAAIILTLHVKMPLLGGLFKSNCTIRQRKRRDLAKFCCNLIPDSVYYSNSFKGGDQVSTGHVGTSVACRG